CPGIGSGPVDPEVERRLLGRTQAGEQPAVEPDDRQPSHLELVEPAARWRHQHPVAEPDAEVAGSARRKPEPPEAPAGGDDRGAGDGLVGHPIASSARSKKVGEPKLPDLSTSASSTGSRATTHGTPGSISGPTSRTPMPSAPMTAPDVSPPATTSRRTPRSTSPH